MTGTLLANGKRYKCKFGADAVGATVGSSQLELPIASSRRGDAAGRLICPPPSSDHNPNHDGA